MENKTEVESIELIGIRVKDKEKKNGSPADSASCRDSLDFDDVLEIVGSEGRYQKFFLYFILVPLSILETTFITNLWFMMDEPPHWCHVPGIEDFGIVDRFEWKNVTIPRSAIGEFSKCEMYTNVSAKAGTLEVISTDNTTIPCRSGWEYDFKVVSSFEFQSILSDYDWVCEKSHYATLVHTAVTAGRATGSLILGILSDKIGRRPVFIITLMLFSIGRAISLYFAYNIKIFMGMSFIVAMGSPMFSITNNTIGAEISGKNFRAWILSLTWATLVIGVVLVPVLTLVTHNWFVLGWTTVLIGSITYLMLPLIPESPRWLLSKGRVNEVVEILKTISSWNGTTDKLDEHEIRRMLEEISKADKESEQNEQGILKLFSKSKVTFHAIIVTFTWVANGLIFHGINLNSLNLEGHRYVNFVLASVAEIPGSLLGGPVADRFGRRWSGVGCGLVCFLCSVVAAYSSFYLSTTSTIIIVVASNTAKIAVTLSFLIIYLQAMEVFPTLLRNTASGVASTTASTVNILVPVIVYSGKSARYMPWIIAAVISFSGMLSASLIPETVDQPLPQSLEEANNVGKGDKFWSYKPKKAKI